MKIHFKNIILVGILNILTLPVYSQESNPLSSILEIPFTHPQPITKELALPHSEATPETQPITIPSPEITAQKEDSKLKPNSSTLINLNSNKPKPTASKKITTIQNLKPEKKSNLKPIKLEIKTTTSNNKTQTYQQKKSTPLTVFKEKLSPVNKKLNFKFSKISSANIKQKNKNTKTFRNTTQLTNSLSPTLSFNTDHLFVLKQPTVNIKIYVSPKEQKSQQLQTIILNSFATAYENLGWEKRKITLDSDLLHFIGVNQFQLLKNKNLCLRKNNKITFIFPLGNLIKPINVISNQIAKQLSEKFDESSVTLIWFNAKGQAWEMYYPPSYSETNSKAYLWIIDNAEIIPSQMSSKQGRDILLFLKHPF